MDPEADTSTCVICYEKYSVLYSICTCANSNVCTDCWCTLRKTRPVLCAYCQQESIAERHMQWAERVIPLSILRSVTRPRFTCTMAIGISDAQAARFLYEVYLVCNHFPFKSPRFETTVFVSAAAAGFSVLIDNASLFQGTTKNDHVTIYARTHTQRIRAEDLTPEFEAWCSEMNIPYPCVDATDYDDVRTERMMTYSTGTYTSSLLQKQPPAT